MEPRTLFADYLVPIHLVIDFDHLFDLPLPAKHSDLPEVCFLTTMTCQPESFEHDAIPWSVVKVNSMASALR